MTIQDSNIEDACKFLLQKKVTLEIKGKILKEGKVILFNQKNFFITFILVNEKNNKIKIEVPIPFDVEIHKDENLVYFDYRIKTLAKHAPEIEPNLLVYPKKSTGNKYWDSILLINANIETNL